MAKNIFRTLKNYSAGFHRTATEEQSKVYDKKIAELKERLLADMEHAPEIIAEEFAKCEVLKWRVAFTEGRVPTDTYTAVFPMGMFRHFCGRAREAKARDGSGCGIRCPGMFPTADRTATDRRRIS